MDNVPIWLFGVGIALFVIGDLLWLMRNTLNRPMNLKLTGTLVGVGVACLTTGLVMWAVSAGGH